ncbi:type IV secretion system DotC family protein [Defluviimonas salinarum]|uniref:Type IV secretion system DotC family protein n=1 Tax=Defluviimonas salinarum TaxID=2992147 RepID=A0ABT3J4J4_9RHOB|nr:type IV secretion system DotC family protein [Defluviimonas salinarum]MCW3782588.1 type IV secretion system DotC family protein [Defluviimonas salinarum]
MKVRAMILLTLSGLTLAGCMQPALERGKASDLNPPMVGAKTDDLRIGKAPPASADAIRIPVYNPDAKVGEVTRIRADALKEAAQSYGSQMGFARRSWEIAGRLEARSSDLSEVFDFNRLVSAAPVKAGVVVPPVVSRSFDAFVTDAEGREASVADEYLTIVRPGRIAPVAPTWRDYLVFTAGSPEEPARSLMPGHGEELDLFEGWFGEGWEAGVALADAEFDTRLDRLKQDYQGMLQYRRLVAQGMMDRMVLADADFGVTEEDGQMRIGSRTVQIVSDASFQSDPTEWKVRSVSERDALIVDTGEIPSLSADLE